MPLYKTSQNEKIVGIYNCQRPSAAACKALTALRRKDQSIEKAVIQVQTEGRLLSAKFDVTYESVNDSFFGSIKMPVARKMPVALKSGEIEKSADLELKKD